MPDSSNRPWSTASFPSPGSREKFLDHVKLWNRIEDLPRIVAEPLPDGRRLRFRSVDPRRNGLWRVIDSFGGWVPPVQRV
jgi:hypothetical protein